MLLKNEVLKKKQPIEFHLQRLQVGEATESSICDEAHAVVSDVELVQQAEAHEAGLLQPGQMVGGEVAVERIQTTQQHENGALEARRPGKLPNTHTRITSA